MKQYTVYNYVYTLNIQNGSDFMVTKLQRWGNSQGIRIPKQILSATYLSEGDNVDITSNGDVIIIRRMNKSKKVYSLDELLSGEVLKQGEEDWGKNVGKEIW